MPVDLAVLRSATGAEADVETVGPLIDGEVDQVRIGSQPGAVPDEKRHGAQDLHAAGLDPSQLAVLECSGDRPRMHFQSIGYRFRRSEEGDGRIDHAWQSRFDQKRATTPRMGPCWTMSNRKPSSLE